MIAMYRVWSNERTERLRAESYLVGPDLRFNCTDATGGQGRRTVSAIGTNSNESFVGTATVERFDCFLFQPDGVQVKDGVGRRSISSIDLSLEMLRQASNRL